MVRKQYLFRDEGAWALERLPLGPQGEEAWREFLNGLLKAFNEAFAGDVTLVVRALSDMEAYVKQAVAGEKSISIDPCISGDVNLGTSRIFLPGGRKDCGVGSRPGFPSIVEQLSTISRGTEFVLVEDDIFSGGTLQSIARILEAAGVKVVRSVCGIQVGDSRFTLPVEAIEQYKSEVVLDLNDPRDFLVGARGGGLVVQTADGALVRVPYVLPFVDTNARSSIPRGRVLDFSKEVWRLNVDFWRHFPWVTLGLVELFLQEALYRWGYASDQPMVEVCRSIMRLLDLREGVPPISSGDKGVIFCDLNNTLVRGANLTVPEEIFRAAVREAKQSGWIIGLCSDFPYDALKVWGERYGMDGPVIAENGGIVDGVSIVRGVNAARIRSLVSAWAARENVAVNPDIYSREFGGGTVFSGIAFGAGRALSVSIFCCVAPEQPDEALTNRLGVFLAGHVPPASIDCSPGHGFVGIHPTENFLLQKGEVLRALGWQLYREGKACWMIGDSLSDITHAPGNVSVGVVGNASPEVKRVADYVVGKPYTEGVCELLGKIAQESI
ncbi:MAG: phosphoribosyltransferase family protein [bacterium]|nr:phosphoribosyltransferase family protein [bacterium]